MATTSYDEVPYLSHPMAYTHPDVLATVARIAGLTPPELDGARVLELGCGTGANLMPMADTLPGASFVGIDLSSRQIAMGNEIVEAAGLENLVLHAESITDFDGSLGPFDYIICHGVYSWVPAHVRDAILDICRRDLTPEGLAYISYNTYPGWHMRGIIRDLLYFHAKHFDTPEEQIANTRGLLDFLVKTFGNDPSSFATIVRGEGERLAAEGDHYLFHEHLETFNEPMYFHQFIEQIGGKGLQYVGEAFLGNLQMQVARQAQEALLAIATDMLDFEQYIDFVVSRTFRRSVICRDTLAVERVPRPAAVTSMYATGVIRPVNAEFNVRPGVPERFEAQRSGTITSDDALLKTALLMLARRWPQSLSFAELRDLVAVHLREAGVDVDALLAAKVGDADPLAARLLQCHLLGTVELRAAPPRYTTSTGAMPRTSKLARFQASQRLPVSNGRHRTADDLNDFDRLVLSHLDGQHDHAALRRALVEAVRSGELSIEQKDELLKDTASIEDVVGEALEPSLRRIAGSALLVE
jgi:methyltransferase-like protein/ubiquinone/menaquinone biosynthesis C-methylase UbiE